MGGRIAIPGERTTAALLLRLLGRFETVPMRFDQIEDAVLRGDVDCGCSFTRAASPTRPRVSRWSPISVPSGRSGCGVRCRWRASPSAAIWHRRWRHWWTRPSASVEYAFAHPEASGDYVAAHAKEMDPDVMARHIRLYVNDYTLALDEDAVHRMMTWAEHEGLFPPGNGSLPLFA